MKKINYKFFTIFAVIALFLSYIFFRRLQGGQFLLMGDQFFAFSHFEAFINSFFLKRLDYLGVQGGWTIMIWFWDTLYYLSVYKLGFSLLAAEKILFFTALFLSQSLAFIGFNKIKSLAKIKISASGIFIVTLWYCFNPYTLSLWHGGVYSLGLALTYSLAPLIFYYFHLAIFSPTRLKNIVICSLLLFIASFVFWLFSVMVFVLMVYSFLYVLFNRKIIRSFLKNILLLLLIYLPLIGCIIFSLLYQYYNNSGDMNAVFLPTYGNQQGGVLYQLLMLFSWGIYTYWTPRSIYSFGEYFFSGQYILATITIYVVIFVGIMRTWKVAPAIFSETPAESDEENPSRLNKVAGRGRGSILSRFRINKLFSANVKNFLKLNILSPVSQKIKDILAFIKSFLSFRNKLLIILLIVLALAVFFAKGAQPPGGQIFVFLYEHAPFFNVFRTPDIRFGFAIVLMISILLLIIGDQYKKYLFFTVIAIAMILQSLLFFNGTAIYGENKKDLFYDRIVYVSPDYQELIDFFNQDKAGAGYILPFPADRFGYYVLDSRQDNSEHQLGQDLLSKFIEHPFLYVPAASGMSIKTYAELTKTINSRDYKLLRNFPIKYLLLRRDLDCSACVKPAEADLDGTFKRVFRNELFSVYEVDGYTPLISSKNAEFQIVNPIEYKIRLNNVKDEQVLNFMLSFSQDWKLFLNKSKNKSDCLKGKISEYSDTRECVTKQKYFVGGELSFLWKKPIFDDTHQLLNGYANSWTITPEYIKKNFNKSSYQENPDGSINIELTLYFRPQSYLYLGLIISSLILMISLGYLGYSFVKRR